MFYKQRNNFFFPVTSYAMPTVLLRVPLSIVTGIIWTAPHLLCCGVCPRRWQVRRKKTSVGEGSHAVNYYILLYISQCLRLHVPIRVVRTFSGPQFMTYC